MIANMVAIRPDVREAHCLDANEGRFVLVVDDHSALRLLIRSILELDGLQVETAEDGFRALDKAFGQCPSLVILDLNLPDVDGESIARRLRSRYGSAVPIVIVSANRDVEEVAVRIGAVAWFSKPFKVSSLLGAVRSALGARLND